MRGVLNGRLGFSNNPAGTGPNQSVLNSYLQQAQKEIYDERDWWFLKTKWTLLPGSGQDLIDYEDAMNPDRFLSVSVFDTSLSQPDYKAMDEGIDLEHRTSSSKARPIRYERLEQLELWPIPDKLGYGIFIVGLKRLDRFEQDNDLLTMDHNMVLLKAIAIGKTELGHEDSQAAELRSGKNVKAAKKKNQQKRRYRRGSPASKENYKPVFQE